MESINTKTLAQLRKPVAAYFAAVQAATERRAAFKPILDTLPEGVRMEHLKVAYAIGMGIPLTDAFKPEGGKNGPHWTAWGTAKVRASRDLKDLYGAPMKVVQGIEVPAHIQALANKLAEACAEYEQARKLCTTAVAQAFAG